MKIRPMGDKLFHDDELGDTLTVALGALANAPANHLLSLWSLNSCLGHFSSPVVFPPQTAHNFTCSQLLPDIREWL